MAKRRRIMRAFKIDELSAVDRPAQEGARVAIMKRDGGDDRRSEVAELLKRGRAVLTTAVDGHTHLVPLENHDGSEVASGTTSWQDEHHHPWVMLEDGTIVIGEVDGHTHAPDQTSKRRGDRQMADHNDQQTEAEKKAAKEKAALEKRLARAERLAELTDAEKAHHAALPEGEREAFLEKSADERREAVEAAKRAAEKRAADEDPVVYTTADGVAIRKSAGEAVAAIAKDHDALKKRNAELAAEAARAALEKRAETELAHLPGTVAQRAALLKAAESIEDEDDREAAVAALKAQNEAMAKAHETFGVTGASADPEPGSPESEIEKIAGDIQKREPKLTPEAAYAKALETPRGKALYTKSLQN